MKVNVLMRECFMENEKRVGVLGVFDDKNIKEAFQKAKEKYLKSSIYYVILDMNEISEYIEK